MQIFVGNLSFEATEADVQKAFSAFGKVVSVAIMMKKNGKKSRGFGFVEMADEQSALAAIAGLNGTELLGRPMNVVAALPKKPKAEPVVVKKELRRKFIPRRQRQDQPKPWRKTEGEAKPWKRTEGGAKPWRKTEGGAKPWKKTEGGAKPWKKTEGGVKPWKKTEGGPKPWGKRRSSKRPPFSDKRPNDRQR